MNDMLHFRRASAEDAARILEIIRQAQAQMRVAGSRQWQNGYPALGDIRCDIEKGYGYVLCQPGNAAPEGVVAYGAVVFDGEAAYDAIEGKWLTPEPYVVLHRLAVADGMKHRGVAGEYLRRVESLARGRGVEAFRVDTNFDNRYMLRLLEKTGFRYCGKIRYDSGERLAFEKRL